MREFGANESSSLHEHSQVWRSTDVQQTPETAEIACVWQVPGIEPGITVVVEYTACGGEKERLCD